MDIQVAATNTLAIMKEPMMEYNPINKSELSKTNI